MSAKLILSPDKLSAMVAAVAAHHLVLEKTESGSERHRTLRELEDELAYVLTQGKKFALVVVEE